MVREYMTELYDPAHTQHIAHAARAIATWCARRRAGIAQIREVWDRVRFVEAGRRPLPAR